MRDGPFLWAREIAAFLLIFVSLATNYIAYFVPFFDGWYIVCNSWIVPYQVLPVTNYYETVAYSFI